MWKQVRGRVRLFAGIVACSHLPVSGALAQSYPVKPIRLLVGFSPGGVVDAAARIVAQRLSEPLGQPVVIENRAGASGAIASEMVARSPADGYTLLLMSSSGAILPALRAKLPYDTERDLAPVSLAAIAPFVLAVHPSVPARNVKELIALARLHPDKLSYGSSGVGSAVHLAGALFNSMAKVSILHVPYKGGGESVIAHAAGHNEISYPSIPALLPFLENGRLRPLALTGKKRVSLMPSVPTLDESGLPGYDRTNWNGVSAPAAVPREVIARLNAAIAKVVNTPEMKEALNRQGLEPQTSTPAQFAAFIHGEIAKNTELIKLIGMKAE